MASKWIDIVSNPTIMDVSNTMDSYGPLSVLLAIIALLLRVALSGAKIVRHIGHRHLLQYTTAYVFKRGVTTTVSGPDIYDLRPCISSGGGQHNEASKSMHSKERSKAWAALTS